MHFWSDLRRTNPPGSTMKTKLWFRRMVCKPPLHSPFNFSAKSLGIPLAKSPKKTRPPGFQFLISICSGPTTLLLAEGVTGGGEVSKRVRDTHFSIWLSTVFGTWVPLRTFSTVLRATNPSLEIGKSVIHFFNNKLKSMQIRFLEGRVLPVFSIDWLGRHFRYVCVDLFGIKLLAVLSGNEANPLGRRDSQSVLFHQKTTLFTNDLNVV